MNLQQSHRMSKVSSMLGKHFRAKYSLLIKFIIEIQRYQLVAFRVIQQIVHFVMCNLNFTFCVDKNLDKYLRRLYETYPSECDTGKCLCFKMTQNYIFLISSTEIYFHISMIVLSVFHDSSSESPFMSLSLATSTLFQTQ